MARLTAHHCQETLPEKTPSFLGEAKGKISEPVVAAFIGGGVAGAVSRTIVSPLERLKILFQIQSVGREEYKLSIWKALVKMGREEGWRGFMRGNGTNCIRIIPYSAVQFGSYNFYKNVSYRPSPYELDGLGVVLTGLKTSQVRRAFSRHRSVTSASSHLRGSSWNNVSHHNLSP